MKKPVLGAIALGLLATSTALAQPSDPAGESSLGGGVSTEQPPQPPQPPMNTMTTTTTTTTSAPAAPVDGRPAVFSLGFGIGYTINSTVDIHTPSTASVRFRLPSGLTFEPSVALAYGGQTTSPDGGNSSTDSTTTFRVGTGIRLPLLHDGKFELEGLGIASLGVVVDNPDGDNNNTTTTTIALNWGLAVNYWITQHWDFSVSGYNPLVSYSHASRDGMGSMSTTDIGIVWDPTLVVMMHLYH
ncbi:MAG TPA: hypothetical protein VGM90_41090 [Kofleriaceae bacterium]|jgi:hypothetical protein